MQRLMYITSCLDICIHLLFRISYYLLNLKSCFLQAIQQMSYPQVKEVQEMGSLATDDANMHPVKDISSSG